jgi:mRNA interferase HigB
MMRIIKKKTLVEYYSLHADAKADLEAWHGIARASYWKTPNDVKATFAKASIIGGNRVVFNICGNSFRLVVKIEYKTGCIYIRFIGTHKEYDKINSEEI